MGDVAALDEAAACRFYLREVVGRRPPQTAQRSRGAEVLAVGANGLHHNA